MNMPWIYNGSFKINTYFEHFLVLVSNIYYISYDKYENS